MRRVILICAVSSMLMASQALAQYAGPRYPAPLFQATPLPTTEHRPGWMPAPPAARPSASAWAPPVHQATWSRTAASAGQHQAATYPVASGGPLQVSPPPAAVAPTWDQAWRSQPAAPRAAVIGSGRMTTTHGPAPAASSAFVAYPPSQPPFMRPLPDVPADTPAYEPAYGSQSGAGGPPQYAPIQPLPDGAYEPLMYGAGAPVCHAPAATWFAGLYGLVMTRDDSDKVWLSYDSADIRDRVLTTHDAAPDWGGGFETRFGRSYGNCAWEVAYWGLFPDQQESNVIATQVVGDLDTILHFDSIYYDPGIGDTLVSSLYFGAERHRVLRNYEFHNVELNFLAGNYLLPCGNPCGACEAGVCGGKHGCHHRAGLCSVGNRFRLGWSAGVRFIKFDDDFLYSADFGDITFTGAPEEIHYGIDVENYLVGFQVGGRADACLWGRLTGVAETRFGVFGNHIRHHSRIYGLYGAAFVDDAASPYDGRPVDISSTKNDVALLGELRLGLDYQITRCWSVALGYRALAVAGVALSTDQIPRDFVAALDSLDHVDSRGSLLLHGGYFGVEYNY